MVELVTNCDRFATMGLQSPWKIHTDIKFAHCSRSRAGARARISAQFAKGVDVVI